jgi:hypothetical protein
MSCIINTDALKNVLLEALQNDFERYRFLKNTASDILRVPALTDEGKANALLAYAYLYQHLQTKSNKYQSDDLYATIVDNISPLIGKNDVNFTTALQPVITRLNELVTEDVQNEKLTIDSLLDEAVEIASGNAVGMYDNVVQFLNKIKTLVDSNVIDNTLGQLGSELDSVTILETLLDEIRSNTKLSVGTKDYGLRKLIQDEIIKYRTPEERQPYVDLRTIPGFGENLFKLYEASGSYSLIAKVGERYFYTDVNNEPTTLEVPEDLLGKLIPLYPVNDGQFISNESGKKIITTADLNTALAITKNDREKLSEDLSGIAGSPMQTVKVVASKTSINQNRERVNQLEMLANSDARLANRKYETHETPAQVRQLRSGQPIVTTYSPINGFTLVLETPSGTRASVFTFDNYAFVYPDNTVVPVDFENPEHLKMFAGLTMVKYGNKRTNTQLHDLQNLKESLRKMREFKREIESLFEEGVDNVEVPQEIFSKYFSLQNNIVNVEFVKSSELRKGQPLQTFIDNVGGGFETDIVNSANPNQPVKKTLPVIYRKTGKGAISVWSPVEMLSSDERVLFNGKQYTWSEYVNNVLRPDLELEYNYDLNTKLESMIGSRYIMIGKFDNKFQPIQIVPRIGNEETSAKANILLSLLSFRNQFDKASSDQNYSIRFNNSRWGLNISQNVKADFFAGDSASGKYVGIAFKALPEHPSQEAFNNNADKLTLVIPDAEFSGIKNIIASYAKTAGLTFDYESEEGQNYIQETLEKLLSSDSNTMSPELMKLKSDIDNVYEKFTNTLSNRFQKKIQDVRNNNETAGLLSEKFYNVLFTTAPGTITVDGKVVGINKPTLSIVDRSIQREGITNFFIANQNINRSVSIRYKTGGITEGTYRPAKVSVAPRVKQAEVAPVIPTAAELTQPAPINNGKNVLRKDAFKDLNDEGAFSLSEALQESIITEQEFQSQLDYVLQRLPKDIAIEDLQKIIHEIKVDGNVLGFIKDKIIYLNNEMPTNGTAYHEAFHAIFRYVLTPQQRKELIAEAFKEMSSISRQQINDFRSQRKYFGKSDAEVLDLMAEEYMAEKFRNYVLEKTEPKSWLRKFFEMLSKLIDFFKNNGSQIDELFDNIHSGYYANAATREFVGDEGAFELIPTIPVVMEFNGSIRITKDTMSSSEIIEIKNRLVHELLISEKINPSMSLNERYEEIAARLSSEYTIDNLVSQVDEAMRPGIEKRYGKMFTNYRYVLGNIKRGEAFQVINVTGDPNYDGVIDNTDPSGFALDAEQSYNLLKRQVLKMYEDLNTIDDSTIQSELSNGVADSEPNLEDPADSDIEEQEIGSDSDVPFLETRPDRGDREFRKTFSYLVYNYVDPTFGVTMKRTTDGELLFDALHKITANATKTEIVPRIVETIQMLNDDLAYFDNMRASMQFIDTIPADIVANRDLANGLQAVLDMLNTICGTDATNLRNENVFNQFHRVFYTASLTMDKIQVETTLNREGTEEDQESVVTVTNTLTLVDAVARQDNFQVVESIKDNYKNNYLNLSEDARIALAKEYQTAINEFLKSSAEKPYFTNLDGSFNSAKLNELTDKVYGVVAQAGLGLPRHFIYFSLLSTASKDNGELPSANSAEMEFIRRNKDLYKSSSYLNQFGFSRLGSLLSYTGTKDFFDSPEGSKNKLASGFISAFSRAAGYISKYDPSMGMPVVYNSEGKRIYRYVKYTPPLLVAQEVNRLGVSEFVRQTYGNAGQNWFHDNPYLSGSTESELFTDNLEVGAFAGLQQTIGFAREGATGKSIDDKAYALSMIGLFANRTTLKRKDADGKTRKITVFRRPISQFEATSTNFTVTALYEQYIKNTGSAVVTDYKGKKVSKSTARLMQVIEQEYNRIRREYATKDDTKQYYNNYNAKVNSAGEVITDDSSLRAYQFMQLADFFGFNKQVEPLTPDSGLTFEEGKELRSINERIQLRDDLRNLAFSNYSFDEAFAQKSDLIVRLLDAYADDMYKNYIDKLNDLQLVELKDVTGEFQEATGIVYDLSSEFLPNEYFIDNERVPAPASANILLNDYFLNAWINGLLVNQVFDGDVAIGIGSYSNYFKRLKSGAAAGDNAEAASSVFMNRKSSYRYAVMKTFNVKLDDADLTKPQTFGDTSSFDKAINFEIADGQSYSTLEHRLEYLRAKGRLDDRSEQLVRAARWRRLSNGEIQELERRKIVLNSKKTVTAHPMVYIKQSEHYINRYDVSKLRGGYNEQNLKTLEELYRSADYFRGRIDFGDTIDEAGVAYEDLYKTAMQQIHEMFTPIRGRELLHTLLNSMEFHRVDQVMDETAVKRVSPLPVIIEPVMAEVGAYQYFPLDTYVDNISYKYAFDQVETSGHSDEVTDGIQQKLLKDSDIVLTKELKKSNPSLYNATKSYRDKQAELVNSNVEKIKRMLLNDDKSVNVTRIYNMIRKSLEQQGADPTMLKYLDVIDGKPVHNPNLPMVTGLFSYYFFSLFSKNVFQPKTAGTKFFHASSLGYKVNIDGEVRYPSVIKNEDGTYVVEILIPRPLAKNAAEREVLERSLSEFFAARIPTEDKRSMLVTKVVGYLDASYVNTVVVPEQVHLWSGSDKDIDALYAQTKATYKNALGETSIYGEYDSYKTDLGIDEDTAKFIEYLHYMSQDELYKEQIDAERQKLRQDPEYRVTNLQQSASVFGNSVANYFNNSIESIKQDAENKFADVAENQDLIKLYDRLIGVMNILKDNKMPASIEELKKFTKKYGSPVSPLIQNEIMMAGNEILKNEEVYEKYLKNERSDSSFYKNLVARRGKNEGDIINKNNFQTPTAILVARGLNSSSKMGIGIAATTNKAISLMVKHDIQIVDPVFTVKVGDSFITNNTFVSDERAHSKIGNLLGMFADSPKNPYPGPLNLNEFNIGTTATMLATGLPKEMAVLINSVGMIKEVIEDYQNNASSAVKKPGVRNISVTRFLKNNYRDNFNQLKDALNIEGLINPETEALDLSMIQIGYNADNIDGGDSVESLGFEVTMANGTPIVNPKIKEFILFNRFIKQFEQSNSIRYNVTRLTDAQKRLRPDFDTFDRLLKAYEDVTTNTEFRGLERVFEENPVYRNIQSALELMNDISSKFFLERSPLVKALVGELSQSIYGINKQEIASQIKGYLALNRLRYNITNDLKTTTSELRKEQYSAFMEMLNGEFWTENKIMTAYESLVAKLPDNAFVKSLRMDKVGRSKNIMLLRSISKAKISAERSEMISDGFEALLMNSDPEVRMNARKIFYYSIIKDGLNRVPYGFTKFLSPELMKGISSSMSQVQQSFEKFGKVVTRKAASMETKEQKMDLFKESLSELFSASFGVDTTGDEVISDLLVKLISRYESQPNETSLKLLNRGQWGKFAKLDDAGFEQIVKGLFPDTYTSIYKFNKAGKVIPNKAYEKFPAFVKKQGYELLTPNAEGIMIIDTKGEVDSNMESLKTQVLNRVGIYGWGDSGYRFPMYMTNVYGQLMILDKVDSQNLIDHIAVQMGSSYLFDDSVVPAINGSVAEYKLVTRQGNPEIAPYIFDKNTGTELNRLYFKSVPIKAATQPKAVIALEYNGEVSSLLLPKQYAKGVQPTKIGDNVLIVPSGRLKIVSVARGKGIVDTKIFVNGKAVNVDLDVLAGKFGFENFNAMKESPTFAQLAKGQDMYVHEVQSINQMKSTVDKILQDVNSNLDVNALVDEYVKQRIETTDDETLEEFINRKVCKSS